jgi:DNA-binding MarR family transcriptional regulator
VAPARLLAAVDRAARQHRKLSLERQQRKRTLKVLRDLAGDAASTVQMIEELGEVTVVAPAQPPSAGSRSGAQGEPPDAPETVIRWIMRLKTLRARYFPEEHLDDAMWDMLLHLAMARLSGSKISVSDLGITVGVPDTTALRKIGELEAAGLVRRAPDPNDRRRSNLELVDGAFERLRSYLVDAVKL